MFGIVVHGEATRTFTSLSDPQSLTQLWKFECDQCKYVSTSVELLNSHKEAKHQGKALKSYTYVTIIDYVRPKHLILHCSQAYGPKIECDQC